MEHIRELTLGEVLDHLKKLLPVSQQPPDPERWLDVHAPDFPIKNPRQVMSAIQHGELEASRVGNSVLVKWRELDRWLSTRRIQPREAQPRATPPPSLIAHLVEPRSRK